MQEIDLDAYFLRIGYLGSAAPTLETLQRLHLLHPSAIAFENLDPLMKRPVPLDPAALERKLVNGLRGGYCYEHNLLFAAVLRRLGFSATLLGARVQWSVPQGVVRPRSHGLLRVDLPEGPHIADVGFGRLTLTAPLRLEPGIEQPTPHGLHRLVPIGKEFQLQARLADRWAPIYQLSLQEQAVSDWEVASWFTSTHPESIFTNSLMAARPVGGLRYALMNRNLSIHHPDGSIERRTLETPAELVAALEQHFRIHLSGGYDDVVKRLIQRPSSWGSDDPDE